MSISMIIVSCLVLLAIILFFWEPIRLDIIALSIPVILVLLEPWTEVSTQEGLSGFANQATITILAMFILSEGIQRSGLVQIMGDKIAQLTTDSEVRQVGVISALAGSIAGILNNTPVVAIFIPMVTNLANKTNTSPSKLLIPLSYASMMGGVMTLLGTSTNLLASDLAARLIDHPFTMFEFTKLGVVILIVGIIYLLTIGRKLLPERIDPDQKLIDEYQMNDLLTEVVIEEDSSLVGKTVEEFICESELDLDVVQIIRDGRQFIEPLGSKIFQAGDHLVICTDRKTLLEMLQAEGLKLVPEIKVTRKQLEEPIKGQKMVEAVLPHGSFMTGQTLDEVNFLERYNSTLLAIRRGSELTHRSMAEITLEAGDVLLLLAGEETLNRLRDNRNFIITREIDSTDYRRSKMSLAVGILGAVIASAAFGLIPIVISALAGVVAMVVTGCVKPNEIYDAVNWQVIFLLAGLIPLGIAMEETGTAQYIAEQLLEVAGSYPPVVTLGLFYLLTAILTNLISNNASVILMIPIAVDAAHQIGAPAFPFVLAVTFAASTAFLTPVGYQTNLMVYGPGGYHFRDFVIVGAPLQLILAIITPFFINLFWGL
ncbi:MAG: SLC13 family permease [Bacillota bacterium]